MLQHYSPFKGAERIRRDRRVVPRPDRTSGWRVRRHRSDDYPPRYSATTRNGCRMTSPPHRAWRSCSVTSSAASPPNHPIAPPGRFAERQSRGPEPWLLGSSNRARSGPRNSPDGRLRDFINKRGAHFAGVYRGKRLSSAESDAGAAAVAVAVEGDSGGVREEAGAALGASWRRMAFDLLRRGAPATGWGRSRCRSPEKAARYLELLHGRRREGPWRGTAAALTGTAAQGGAEIEEVRRTTAPRRRSWGSTITHDIRIGAGPTSAGGGVWFEQGQGNPRPGPTVPASEVPPS